MAPGVVDLHPAGFRNSWAYAASGDSQVGAGFDSPFGDIFHALLWNGSGASVVDLNPAGFSSSQARGATGNLQVGFGQGPATGDRPHALLWTGTASSVVDLHQYLTGLGPTFLGSQAYGVASNGDVVGFAFDSTSPPYAVLWTRVPEPSTLMLFWCGLFAAAFVRRRRPRPQRF